MKTTSPFSVLKTLFFASFFSAFLFGSTAFAAVHSVENISEKVKGDRLSLSDVNSILGTIRGFFFDDSDGNVGIGTTGPTTRLEVLSETATNENFNKALTVGTSIGGGQGGWIGSRTASANQNQGLMLSSSQTLTLHGDNAGDGSSVLDILGGSNPDIPGDTSLLMRVNSDGNVGIGTTSPSAKLHIVDKSASGDHVKIYRSDTSPNLDIYSTYDGLDNTNNGSFGYGVRPSDDSFGIWEKGKNTNWTNLFLVQNDGNVGIGTTDPDEMLEVSGSVKSNGTILTSDSRFKQNIKPISAALEKVSALRGVHFDWKKDQFPEKNFADGTQLGLIAQEVESVFPEVVSTDANGLKSVNYPALIAPLVQSIHTLKLQNEALQSELQEIKNELAGW